MTATNHSSHIDAELASQPACWAVASDLAALDRGRLPSPGERVAVIGCGTSLYMARAYAALREATGSETDAFPASEFPVARRYDRVVAISRSGTTTEVLETLTRIAGLGNVDSTTAITADVSTAVANLADHVIDLSAAGEQSVVQTRFPTTVLALFRAALGEDLGPLISAGEWAVTAALPVDPGGLRQATFLGRGWAAAVADEAALKCREAAGFWTESYPAMEYRHGPIAVSGPGGIVWMFGAAPPGLDHNVAATGAQFVNDDVDPMVDLIRAQRLAVALAHREGRDPDHPRALTFSVVLDPERP